MEGTPHEGTCTWGEPVIQMAIAGNNIHVLTNVPLTECKTACQKNYLCLSIDYKNEDNRCAMNGVTHEQVPLTPHDEYDYREILCVPGN